MPGKFDSLSKLVRMSPELVEKQTMLFDKIRNSVRGSKTDPKLWVNISDSMLDKMAKSGEIHPGLVDEIKQFKVEKQNALTNLDPKKTAAGLAGIAGAGLTMSGDESQASPLSNAKKILESVPTVKAQREIRLNPEKYKEYLTALDDVYGSKAKRQFDQGYSPKQYFHGTGSDDIKAFSDDKLGSITGEGITKKQHWVTDNPEVAELFANQAANKLKTDKLMTDLVAPYNSSYEQIQKSLKDRGVNDINLTRLLNQPVREIELIGKVEGLPEDLINKIKDTSKMRDDLRQEEWRLSNTPSPGANILPVKIRDMGIPTIDAKGDYWSNLKEKIGSNQIKVKNLIEGSPQTPFEVPKATNVGITEPERIRSNSAAFDPRFKNSDDILSLNGDSKFKTLGNVLYNKAGNQLSKQIPLMTDSAKETLGKAGEVLSNAADKVDQYVFNPARAAVSGALEGKNPLKSAYENKPTSGSDIVEKSGIAKFMNPNPVSALESEEAYKRGEELSEKSQEMTKDVLGQGIEMAIDPTMGISPAMKFGKVLKYLK